MNLSFFTYTQVLYSKNNMNELDIKLFLANIELDIKFSKQTKLNNWLSQINWYDIMLIALKLYVDCGVEFTNKLFRKKSTIFGKIDY